MNGLIKITATDDIFKKYIDTPIEQLIRYHNFGDSFKEHSKAELLVGMCMDNRKQLKIPNNFAYILRTGGGNLRPIEFKISYTIAIGGVKYIAMIGHDHCGMVNLTSKKEAFMQGMIQNAGWTAEQAEEHFLTFAPTFEIDNELDFLVYETKRFREKYPKIMVAPLFYQIADNQLYLLETDSN